MTSKFKNLWMVEDRPATNNKPQASFWTKIGVAFENKDGSYTLHLAAIPVNGRIQMRDPGPKDQLPENVPEADIILNNRTKP